MTPRLSKRDVAAPTWWVVIGTVLISLGLPAVASSQTVRERRGPFELGAEERGVRPPDNSDPEMRTSWQEIMSSPRCPSAVEICEPRKSLLSSGGDRLAAYLIRQYESSLEEGYAGAGHYLSHIAATRSERGIRYLLDEFSRPHVPQMQILALQGLVYAGDPRAIDLALDVLSKTNHEPRVDLLSLTVARKNLEATGPSRPEAVRMLQDMERESSPKPWLRVSAFRALNALEAKGIIQTRSAPPDLLLRMPTRPE